MALPALTDAERQWVDRTLAALDVDGCLGQLLCPDDRRQGGDGWRDLISQVPIGSVFFSRRDPGEARAAIDAIQAASRIPVLVASDFEHGAGMMIAGETDFPWPMAVGAADDTELAFALGKATAREARAHGYHWTFGPVADLHYNFQCPVLGPRALGDDPARVSRLISAWIKGMQDGGMLAAGAKHFPGDGIDDRDQHLCTSVNSLDMPTWWRTYGSVWRACIDAGTLSIMTGHISLPHYQGCAAHPEQGLPATIDPRLQIDLLRGQLGFEGVIVSDAAPMLGLTTRTTEEERAVRFIAAGGDVWLFADARKDFARLRAAVADGRLQPERIRASARRVLEMKARLGLHRQAGPVPLPPDRQAAHRSLAQEIADRSIVLQRSDAHTPLRLAPGARVLAVTLRDGTFADRPDLSGDLETVAEELERRGFTVTRLVNPSHRDLFKQAREHQAVFVNINLLPHQRIGNIRLCGEAVMPLWRSFWTDHPCVIFTSFGNPWLLYQLPHLPNLWLAWGHPEASQRAAVRAWLGEIPLQGTLPVRMPRLAVDPATLNIP
jgi:beta-N-acetylhexosaminidase